MSAVSPRRADLGETEARLVNWARWVEHHRVVADLCEAIWDPEAHHWWAEGRPEVYGVFSDAGFTADEADAEALEARMLALKRLRPSRYRALWQRFVLHRDDLSGADALGCHVQRYQQLCEAGLKWLARDCA